jgi:hypothetical protein
MRQPSISSTASSNIYFNLIGHVFYCADLAPLPDYRGTRRVRLAAIYNAVHLLEVPIS